MIQTGNHIILNPVVWVSVISAGSQMYELEDSAEIVQISAKKMPKHNVKHKYVSTANDLNL